MAGHNKLRIKISNLHSRTVINLLLNGIDPEATAIFSLGREVGISTTNISIGNTCEGAKVGIVLGSVVRRQVNWLDFDLLKMASRINGINKLVINKMDVLDTIGKWYAYHGPHVLKFDSRDDMEFWIETKLEIEVGEGIETFFSGDKEFI